MKKILSSVLVATFLTTVACADTSTIDWSNTSIGADAGTTGIGITFVKGLEDYEKKWGVRVGYHQFKKSFDVEDDTTKYDLDIELQDVQLMADYHPWNSSFKWTFGFIYNGTNLKGNVKPNSSATQIVINNQSFNISKLASVDAKIDFKNKIAPYIGIGWDTSFYQKEKTWGFTCNLGVAYFGKAEIEYTPHIIDPTISTQVNSALAKAKEEFNRDSADKFKYYPYISIGFNYKFN